MRALLLTAAVAACTSAPPKTAPDAPVATSMSYRGEAINGVVTGATIEVPQIAAEPGDAVILQIFNGDQNPAPTTYSISGSGWTFMQVATTPIGTTFVAIVPPSVGTLTVTSTSPAQPTWINGDHFSDSDASGGATTFDAFATTTCLCVDTCTAELVTGHDNDMVWAGMAPGYRTQPGPGFTAGDIIGDGPRTEYRLTNDSARTIETVSMTATESPTATCTLTAIAIKPL